MYFVASPVLKRCIVGPGQGYSQELPCRCIPWGTRSPPGLARAPPRVECPSPNRAAEAPQVSERESSAAKKCEQVYRAAEAPQVSERIFIELMSFLAAKKCEQVYGKTTKRSDKSCGRLETTHPIQSLPPFDHPPAPPPSQPPKPPNQPRNILERVQWAPATAFSVGSSEPSTGFRVEGSQPPKPPNQPRNVLERVQWALFSGKKRQAEERLILERIVQVPL